MSFKHLTRFIAALLLGLVIALTGTPSRAQDVLQICYAEVDQYPDYDDLDQYSERQLYCLFVVELVDGEVEVGTEYENDELETAIMDSLSDEGDSEDDNTADDKLTFDEIQAEFSDDQLNELIRESVEEADNTSKLLEAPQLRVAMEKAIAPKAASLKPNHQIAGRNNKARGGTAVQTFARKASRRAKS